MPTSPRARRITRRTSRAVGAAILSLLCLGGCDAWQARRSGITTESAPLVTLASAPRDDGELRDRDIAFYQQRTVADAHGATDRVTLASLLLARARTSGAEHDVVLAESLAQAAFDIRQERNTHALEVLATARMARHDFSGAREAAALADRLEPGNASHLALLGEVELELGDYAAADTHFRAVRTTRDQFTVGARLARWYELTGQSARARVLLRDAIRSVEHRSDLPREQVAWFHYRLGELELRTGHIAAADSSFARGLARNPDDVRALGGLARAALARGDFQHAARLADQATMIQLDPTTLGTASRAYAALGDTAQAEQYARAMAASALAQRGPLHRAWGLHLLDFGTPRDRAEVLRRARADLRTRRDVYGHDLLAWALHRTGDDAAARREMTLALAQRTEDVLIRQHAQLLLPTLATR